MISPRITTEMRKAKKAKLQLKLKPNLNLCKIKFENVPLNIISIR